MKKHLIMILPVLFILTLGQSALGFGPGAGTCPGNGTGQLTAAGLPQNICNGTPETLAGEVIGGWVPGAGLTIQTDAGPQTIFGLGPIWYWNSANFDRPELGENITAAVSGIIGSDKKVILSITLDGQTLQLRDQATCLPLWRGKRAFQKPDGATGGPAFVQ